MKLLSSIAVALSAIAASNALSVPFRGGKQAVVALDNVKVPGESPLEFCKDSDLSKNILDLEYVDLNPNPPTPGNTLTIEAAGILSKDVGNGAYANIVVKYGLITLIRMTVDLCEEGKKIDLNCPLKKGPMKLTKDVDLPKQIPPGKYTVSANVFTDEDEPVTCLTTTIQFH